MKIFVSQLNLKIGDLDQNTEKVLRDMDRARTSGSEIIIFPEMTICGYMPEDLLYHHSFIDSMYEHLEKIVKNSHNLTVFVGLVRRNTNDGTNGLCNSCAIISNGKLKGFYDKWLLPTYDVFTERRYFDPGKELCITEVNGKRVGVIICEDIWQHAGKTGPAQYKRDPVEELKKEGIDLLLNLSASPYQYQKPDTRVEVCAKAAKTLNCPVILCCQVGGNDQILFDGYSVCVNADGTLRQLAKGFEEDVMIIDVDAPTCTCPFEYDVLEDLYQSLVMGVRDYFHKQGFTKACLGLSGGIDSALVICIAKDALGPENVLGIMLPSRYSSKESVTDSISLAKNLGVETIEIPIEKPFTTFLDLLKPHFGDKPTDVTEENMQARIRGLIIMAYSNKNGHIVLSTGNKSETALGYSTLYGDMCGGLGVIGDVIKTKVYKLCRYINRNGEIIPQNIIDRPPSAELRPDQKDLDSLPDYGIVDAVLQGYVEEYLSLDEISSKYKIPLETVMNLVQRIHRAEYKRRQGPPILRVTRKSFGVGRRYPIVQGWM
ncbi:MAG: NAD+ synthase [Candidatus Algichlamydia australiensis]|nr:NAD+ synthase [Chlamydiales bacterium]